MKTTFFKYLTCFLLIGGLSSAQTGSQIGTPPSDAGGMGGDYFVDSWTLHFNGQGINDQYLTVGPTMAGKSLRASLEVNGHKSGYAGLLVGTNMAPPQTLVWLGGQASQLFLDLNSVRLTAFASFDFTTTSASGLVNFEIPIPLTFGPPSAPVSTVGLQWFAQAYVTSSAGTELSSMAGGIVGNCIR